MLTPNPVDFADKKRLTWTIGPCAQSWNVYRETVQALVDVDDDGLADGYGTCFAPGLAVPEVLDQSNPPPGQVHVYLVTAENTNGEGGIGYTGQARERPNATPCP